MAVIDQEYLEEEIDDARKTLNHNIAERINAEKQIAELDETISTTRGAIRAFEYLMQGKLEEETVNLDDIEEPDDSDPVREEA